MARHSLAGSETEVADLLGIDALPGGFEYPREFVRVVELGLTQIEPWWILDGERLRNRYLGLRERYSDRKLVPFAIRQDNDDVACWDISSGNIAIVHDFASPGWEQRAEYPDFYAWFRQAVEDFIEWD
jgi:hypothetical protein